MQKIIPVEKATFILDLQWHKRLSVLPLVHSMFCINYYHLYWL